MQTLPPATLVARATNRDFSIFMTYDSSCTTIIPLRNVVMSRNAELGYGAFNQQRYSNPAVDGPLAQALTTMDEERRRDRVVYDPSPPNLTEPRLARPPG